MTPMTASELRRLERLEQRDLLSRYEKLTLTRLLRKWRDEQRAIERTRLLDRLEGYRP